ncbi:MAG TPA: class I SAM-dependent methyltransferase [Streptosporangiaceae bacterium]|nr:class I SAM-dependent methyltransferase [Streptosporangiaceae bacterium]
MQLVPPPPVLRQGVHPDPADPTLPPPDPRNWPKAQQQAFASAEMKLFRACLSLPGSPDVRAAVLDDLSSYSGLPPEECVQRCRNWESWSVEEWLATDRPGTDRLTAFYQATESWAFDLMWYAYMQATGYGYPSSVLALRAMAALGNGRSHLDFGSGAGVTSQLFARAGYETTLADISTSLLDFARHRLSRRGETARFIDLNEEKLETGRYDVITALDTLVHVPDLADVVAGLHRALRPGGWLLTNFDVRPPSPENAWHLYDDDLDLRATVHRAGFVPCSRFGPYVAYRRVDPSETAQGLRVRLDQLVLTSRPRRFIRRHNRRLAAALWRTAR